MSQREPGANSNGLSMLQAALLDDMEQAGATQGGYASYLDVSRNTLSNWLKIGANPLRNGETREILGDTLVLNQDELRVLGATSVEEACQIVLEAKAAEDPRSREIQQRFFGMIIKNGTKIPQAAYIIFLTGDLENRQRMVEQLEEQGFAET